MLKTSTLVLIVATLVTLGSCFIAPSEEEELKCMSESNIKTEELDDNFPLTKDNGDDPIDQRHKNFAKCSMKILGLSKEDGNIDIEKLADLSITPERKVLITKIGNDCKAAFESVKNDEPEYAFRVMNCIFVKFDREKKKNHNEA